MNNKKKGPSKRGRDAGTGQFIPVKEAIKRPKKAIVERVKDKKPTNSGGPRKK